MSHLSLFTKDMDLRLIQLVKQNPLIYNSGNTKYTDGDSREVVWQRIGDELNRSPVQFAGIQCQIQFGDFQEDKHKSGFLENLREYLPEAYTKAWGVEKRVLKEYRKHSGLGALEAKHLYLQVAKGLPTYGVTFFLVKEKQNEKKKLIPRLLGINATSIMRLDEVSKEVLQQWPLTHLKTYQGCGETFTLNFGDYSDKEYSVKTRDAYRIRDVLESYIDLIRKKMAAAYDASAREHGAVLHEHVGGGSASIIQMVQQQNNPMKMMEQTFVGPSKIVPYEPGKSTNQGTQIVTVQQIVVSEKAGGAQQGIKGAVPAFTDIAFVRRLNRCNSNAVKIVSLLTDPTESNIEDARNIVKELNTDMPYIKEGVEETIKSRTLEDDRKRLQEQMLRLDKLVASLTECTHPDSFDLPEATEAAVETADLTTHMYLSMDTRSRNSSRIIKRSHKSFIEDELTQQNIRRASLIAAAAAATGAADLANSIMAQSYPGPALTADQVAQRERALAERLAKLNAALAHYIFAHSDPNNIDYSSAVNAMNTVHELMPEYARDVQAVSSTKCCGERLQLAADMQAYCAALNRVCAAVGAREPQEIREASDDYAKASGRMRIVFGKRGTDGQEKEKELINLANEVESCSSRLTSNVKGLVGTLTSEGADKLNLAVRKIEGATDDLKMQTKLCAASICEPHCRSALTAASVALSSSLPALTAGWQPAVQGEGGERLHHHTLDLSDALDRFNKAFDCYNDEDDDVFKSPNSKEHQRLKFINSLAGVRGRVADLEKTLGDRAAGGGGGGGAGAGGGAGGGVGGGAGGLAARLAHLNAAVAALLLATTDKDNPDYKSADAALTTISELMPHVVEDAKTVTLNKDDEERADMMTQIRDLCDAVAMICGDGGNVQDQKEGISKFSDAAGKMVYVVSRSVNPDKEQQMIGLSSQACGSASQLLLGVQALVAAGGAEAGELDARGARLADDAQALLTVAQITGPSLSDARCQSSLLSSIDKVSSSAAALAHTWAPLSDQPEHKNQVLALEQAKRQLDEQLDKLRKACRLVNEDAHKIVNTPKNQEKVDFITKVCGAKYQIQQASEELDKTPPAITLEQAATAKKLLSYRLGLLNAAIASLIAATADRENPDYHRAEQAVKTISEMTPQIVLDTLAVSSSASEGTRSELVSHARALGLAAQTMCDCAAQGEGVSEAAAEYGEMSARLRLCGSQPPADHHLQVVEQASGACSATSQLLMGVQALVAAGGAEAEVLDARGAALADAAQALLAQAQVTASTIAEPQCKSILLSAIDDVSSSSSKLSEAWIPLEEKPQHKQQLLELEQARRLLEEELEKLRQACQLAGAAPPAAPSSPTAAPALPRSAPPPAPRRGSSPPHKKEAELTNEFLHRLREDESQHAAQAASSVQRHTPAKTEAQVCHDKKTDDEKRLHQQFVFSVDTALQKMALVHEDLKKTCESAGSVSSPAISASEMARTQERMQHNIALMGLEVANIVSANYADKIDYSAASKATAVLPKLMTETVLDGKLLSGTMGQSARREFLQDMLEMCDSSRLVCEAARDDRQNLNEAAVDFGNSSNKVLYEVCDHLDPGLEKEIIFRAKAIGDSASRLAVEAGEVIMGASGGDGGAGDHGGRGGDVRAVCGAGAGAVDAAGKLLYTAKLVAPCLHEPACQEALVSSADSLSSHLHSFTSSWKPFSADPQKKSSIRHLEKEAENLDRILEGLKSDVAGGRLGGARELQRLHVQESPLRSMALDIIHVAQQLSTSSELSPARRRGHAEQAAALSAARARLDRAAARAARAPHDKNKRIELENSINQLQMTLLSGRPAAKRGDVNIVDLRDFIEEVSTEAKNLSEVAKQTKVSTERDRSILKAVADKCAKISSDAYNVTHSNDTGFGFDSSYGDISDVDKFGNSCEGLIKQIESELKGMEDEKTRKTMMMKLLPLTESSLVMRFEAKCGVSESTCLALQATLDELDDVESRLISGVVRDVDVDALAQKRAPPPPARRPPLPATPPALTSYAALCATNISSQEDKDRLLHHLYKLVSLSRQLAATRARRAALWQSTDSKELQQLQHKIIEEFRNPESKYGVTESKSEFKLLEDAEVNKLLMPGETAALGNAKQQQEKLLNLASSLCSSSSKLVNNVSSPSLRACASETARAASQLAAAARGTKWNLEPASAERVEECVEEMTFTTYNFIKSAETATQEPNNQIYKQRLQEACRNLNETVKKLLRCLPSPALGLQCASLCLSLQPPPDLLPPTMPYSQTTEALAQQQEIIYRMKAEEKMPAAHFRQTLEDVTEAVARSSQYASQCAYLISVSESDKELSTRGIIDVPRIEKSIQRLQDSCLAVIGSTDVHRANEEFQELQKPLDDFSLVMEEAQVLVRSAEGRDKMAAAGERVRRAAGGLGTSLAGGDMGPILNSAVVLLKELNDAQVVVEKCPLLPTPGKVSKNTQDKCDEITNHSKSLLERTRALVKAVGEVEESEHMTWVTFSTSRSKLMEAYDALLKSIRVNGQRSGILEGSFEEEAEVKPEQKSYLDTQIDLANKWLKRPTSKIEVKTEGQQAVLNIIEVARSLSEELDVSEREDMRQLMMETEELLMQCQAKYDSEKYCVLAERVKELKKLISRGVVTRVVEDFMGADDPLQDLETFADAEKDASKRKLILERKLAELLAQLGRVRVATRVVAAARGDAAAREIHECAHKAELLAPVLVKAAEERIHSKDQQAIDYYRSVLEEYTQSLLRVREMCDASVEAMDFVQTAGDTMQRLREEQTDETDPLKCAQTSQAIMRLANRTIDVSLARASSASDAELAASLRAARDRLTATAPGLRPSRLPDWRDTTAQIIRTTGEVESALGGENIFQKEPQGSNDQIYNVALSLHQYVREWSSRDNEVVAAAKKMAVAFARLAEYMRTDNKSALIATSKAIVVEAHEVAALARKLALECSDMRIRNELLQTCERIPTISGQLKMLTTVKGSSLGRQGSEEDKAAMDMLVGNAQSLMLSVQEVVKVAAGASVKIMSQRGTNLKWVRKTYY